MKNVSRLKFVVIGCVLLCCLTSHSYSLGIKIEGKVTDVRGNAIKEANVKLLKANLENFTDSNGYFIIEDNININTPNDLPLNKLLLNITPNFVYITCLEENIQLSINIYNVKGQIVFKSSIERLALGKHILPTKKLISSGIYFTKLKINKNKILIKKLIFQHNTSNIFTFSHTNKSPNVSRIFVPFSDTLCISKVNYYKEKIILSQTICNIDTVILYYEHKMEQAYPNKTGLLKSGYIKTENGYSKIYYELIDSECVVHGDIILQKNDILDTFSSEISLNNRSWGILFKKWPNNKVPYEISSDFPNSRWIELAIEEYHKKTNVKFVHRYDETDYIIFKKALAPNSFSCERIGKTGGPQSIKIGAYGSHGQVIHEIGHALGLCHEHTRTDNSSVITIHWENIPSPPSIWYYQYIDIFGPRPVDKNCWGQFDINSIMMYPPDPPPGGGPGSAITLTNGSLYSIQRDFLSPIDSLGLSCIYQPVIKFIWWNEVQENFGLYNIESGTLHVKGTVGDLRRWNGQATIVGNKLCVSGWPEGWNNKEKVYIYDLNTGNFIKEHIIAKPFFNDSNGTQYFHYFLAKN